ncbi:hypothetical protein HPB48_026402 [Haemaphysalis longicornis]|uniref:Uncharacterized protein n=1 Tax=Haemaphysalis longicornis TaxID=44386 RepID=A0A9J6H9K8_HAELO|nr:hypothetical protein HPB48_026402 [Haemaphysalis longicornis]
MWKMLAVPGLTFANTTLCLSAGTREFSERRQRDAGTMAFGVHKNTQGEEIPGDLGWSSFTAREAVAKLSYEGRLLRLPDTNLAHQTLIHTIYSGIPTRWTQQTANQRCRYEVSPEFIAEAAAQPVSTREARIQAEVTKVETRDWLEGAKAKPSRCLYSATKTTIGREKFFDTTLGSGLLAEARLGVLRTRVWRAKFTGGLDTTFTTCGAAEQTTSHVVIELPAVTLAPERQTLAQPAACTILAPGEGDEEAAQLLQDDASAAAAEEACSAVRPARSTPAPSRGRRSRRTDPFLNFLDRAEANREIRHQENLQLLRRILKAFENCSNQRRPDV